MRTFGRSVVAKAGTGEWPPAAEVMAAWCLACQLDELFGRLARAADGLCQRFHDEQRAIHQAWQVSRYADAVLSSFGVSGQTAGATQHHAAQDTRFIRGGRAVHRP